MQNQGTCRVRSFNAHSARSTNKNDNNDRNASSPFSVSSDSDLDDLTDVPDDDSDEDDADDWQLHGPDGVENDDGDDSNDDATYAAVDDISDGDEEDQNVEKEEELMIMQSENANRRAGVFGSLDAGSSGLFESDGVFLASGNVFDEDQLYTAMEMFGESDGASDEETPMPRHVHFQEIPSSSSSSSPSSSSTSDSELPTEDELPGDFLQKDRLDPQLRRMIENDSESRFNDKRRLSDDIFAESDYGNANIYHVESDAESTGSSGYESMQSNEPSYRLPLLILLCPQPTMVKRQMKILHPQRPLRTRDRFFDAIRACLLFREMSKSTTPGLLAAGVQSWVHSWPIPTSPLL